MDIQLIERVQRYVLGAVKEPRYEHSVRTAETARRLCLRYGADPEAGYLAGIAHDMCKEMSQRLVVSLASADGMPVSPLEEGKPMLLHGRAAAVKLRSDFGVEDGDILAAVRNHTFGRPGMGMLEKIVYAADKIEPGRENSSAKKLEKLMDLDIDVLVYVVLKENLAYLHSRGREVAPLTLLLYADMEKRAGCAGRKGRVV